MNNQGHSRDTSGLIDRMFNELDLLHSKKITPARARASAALGAVIVDTAQLAITHHRLKPKRNGRVMPVQLGGRVVEGQVVGKEVASLPRLKNGGLHRCRRR